MFVSQAKYDQMYQKAVEATVALNLHTRKWNKLVDRINALGGEDFLCDAEDEILNTSKQFNTEEINTLVFLCHPDRHSNSKVSTEITKKLLIIRNK